MSDGEPEKEQQQPGAKHPSPSPPGPPGDGKPQPHSNPPDPASPIAVKGIEEKKEAKEQDPKNFELKNSDDVIVKFSSFQERRSRKENKAAPNGNHDATNERKSSQADRNFVKNSGTTIGEIQGASVGEVGTTYNAKTIHIHVGAKSAKTASKSADTIDQADDDQSTLSWPNSAFAACRDNIDDIAFLMSAAVLDGRAIGAVRSASADLARRLSGEIRLPADAPPPPLRFRSIDRLFAKFRIRTVREKDEESGSFSECVRFLAPTDAADVLVHGWTRLSGFPNWLNHLTDWLRDLGANDRQEIRVSAGQAAGWLWISGAAQVEKEMTERWYADESILPLDALDACYVTAAQASPIFKEQIRSELWAWGNITYGIDDIFALRHLSTRRYRIVDPQACFDGLEALLGKNNLLGLVHVQEAYERLFVNAMDEPTIVEAIAESLLRVLAKAKAKNDTTLRIQAIAIALSLIEAERRSKGQGYFVLDRVLEKASDTGELARLINTVSAGSAIQAPVIRALRAVFMRGLDLASTADWTTSHILRLFDQMYASGNAQERERLLYYLNDWIVAAAGKSPTAVVVGRALVEHMLQRNK